MMRIDGKFYDEHGLIPEGIYLFFLYNNTLVLVNDYKHRTKQVRACARRMLRINPGTEQRRGIIEY